MFEQLKDVCPGREFLVDRGGALQYGFVIEQKTDCDKTLVRLFNTVNKKISKKNSYKHEFVNNTIVTLVEKRNGITRLDDLKN